MALYLDTDGTLKDDEDEENPDSQSFYPYQLRAPAPGTATAPKRPAGARLPAAANSWLKGQSERWRKSYGLK